MARLVNGGEFVHLREDFLLDYAQFRKNYTKTYVLVEQGELEPAAAQDWVRQNHFALRNHPYVVKCSEENIPLKCLEDETTMLECIDYAYQEFLNSPIKHRVQGKECRQTAPNEISPYDVREHTQVLYCGFLTGSLIAGVVTATTLFVPVARQLFPCLEELIKPENTLPVFGMSGIAGAALGPSGYMRNHINT